MRLRSNRASVVLVALSCVTVLGIAMASFLAVTNQSMRLSNRDYAKVVSKQLAEMGLELALQAYNANTFSTGWTLSGSTATVALTTVAAGPFPALLSLGSSGITPRVNVRVEHYLAAKKATPWSVLVTYAVGDSVWYQGVWYRCKATTTNQDPSTTAFWTAAPQVWDPYANYKIGNIVLWGGIPYRCIAANINNLNNLVVSPPPNATYWTAASTASWSAVSMYRGSHGVCSSECNVLVECSRHLFGRCGHADGQCLDHHQDSVAGDDRAGAVVSECDSRAVGDELFQCR